MGKKKADVLVAYLLDRTGSMQSIKDDVIGGFNRFLRDQRGQDGKCRFVLTLFDSQSIDTQDFASISKVPELTDASYVPRASTPLYDAIGKTIRDVDALEAKVSKTLFVIHTDGYENASHEFTKDGVKKLIAEHGTWDFVFLGADIDAMAAGQALGIAAGNTFSTSGTQTAGTYAAVADSLTDYRQDNANWQAKLQDEVKRQKKVVSK